MDVREMCRGDSLVFDVRVKDSLVDAKLWMSAKYAFAHLDSEAVFKLTSEPGEGIEILDAPGGRFRVTVAPEKTRHLADATIDLHYDIRMRDAAGKVQTIEHGTFRIKPSVTRDLT